MSTSMASAVAALLHVISDEMIPVGTDAREKVGHARRDVRTLLELLGNVACPTSETPELETGHVDSLLVLADSLTETVHEPLPLWSEVINEVVQDSCADGDYNAGGAELVVTDAPCVAVSSLADDAENDFLLNDVLLSRVEMELMMDDVMFLERAYACLAIDDEALDPHSLSNNY